MFMASRSSSLTEVSRASWSGRAAVGSESMLSRLTFLPFWSGASTEKARLFGADDIRRQILQSGNPGQAKALGRQIIGFKDDVWNAHRFDIVCQANRAKFSQHDDLKAFLLQTGNRVLVEASPMDSIWGIGLAQDDPRAENPLQWQGLNLLGFALMKVRDQLQAA